MMPTFVPKLPSLDTTSKYLERSWSIGQLSNFGPNEFELRERLADYLGFPIVNVITMANATLALQGALSMAEVGGASWGVPDYTFAATYMAAEVSGQRYEILDVNKNARLDEKYLGPRLEVLPFGADLEEPISHVSKVIIDAAASFDAVAGIGQKMPSNYGLVISFHPTKVLIGGEGAIFASMDGDWVERVRRWSAFGIDSNRTPIQIGTNAKLNELSAAVALASLDEWGETKRLWLELQAEVSHIIKESGYEQTRFSESRALVSPYLNLRLPDANAAILRFREFGLEARRWWIPASQSRGGVLRGLGNRSFPNSEFFFNHVVGIPFYLGMDTRKLRHLLLKSKI